MSDLTLSDIRIDVMEMVGPGYPSVIHVDAAAEMTRYHCLFTKIHGEWWVMIENLSYPVALPALPHLAGWYWDWVLSKMSPSSRNERTAMALTLLMQHAADTYGFA